MDRITKSYLDEFVSSFGLENISDETKQFEHFVNYTVIDHRIEERFDLEEIHIGKDSTIGLDGFAIILNKRVISTEDELNDLLKTHNDISAEIVFIQAKTSRGFETKEIGNFGWAITDFIGEKPKIQWSDIAKEKILLFNKLISNTSKLRAKPNCLLYYVTLGIKTDDQNVLAKLIDVQKNIEAENLFSKLTFELLGANEIQILYKKIGQAVSKSFEFPQKVMLPVIDKVKESYLGVLKGSTIIELMTDENGDLIPNVFYDNVRDFQGDNNVNKEIATTINSEYKDAFLILNNGITIVAEELETTRNTFTISNYQIINGCQTSNVLLENMDKLDESVMVPVKLISSKNRDITAKLIRSTNRQTEVKEQDLIAFSNFQKKLEDYYKTFTGANQLFYERRSKQYAKSIIEKKRIVDKTTQIKSVASFYFEKPDLATRYFGTLFSELGNKLFDESHQLILYYTASYALYRIEEGFRKGLLNKRYKKIKYFILMMLRYEIDNNSLPPFNSAKMERFCENAIKRINSDKDFNRLLKNVISKINSLKLDLDDREISKSKILVTNCLRKYSRL
jgi:hypothetical protein